MASTARSRFRTDRQLSVRMLTVMGALALAYAAAIAVLILVLGRWWPLGVAAVAGFFAFQMLSCDKVALRVAGAQEVDAEQEPRLHAIVDRLCALADTPKPRLAVASSSLPNAFAAGRRRENVVLCVTRGMLAQLEDEELEGVLAHELAHVAHGDAVVMTVASFIGVLAGLTARLGARLMLIAGRARGMVQFLLVALAVTALAAATWLVSVLLVRALSRYREFAADQAAAQLTGNPAALSAALVKTSAEAARIPHKDLRHATALNAFYFCPVQAAGKTGHQLLSTHPSVEARIERLERIAAALR
ncbi:M48 family metalloprotease [Actinospica robiniae]|uniref:M48 family metalloprotease n=1 Tax=Actinospica robiniae TaxID=304901 RepID=UPI0005538C21|nr:M48 family metalloprotease [Actinospica robiniae]